MKKNIKQILEYYRKKTRNFKELEEKLKKKTKLNEVKQKININRDSVKTKIKFIKREKEKFQKFRANSTNEKKSSRIVRKKNK